MESTEGFRIRPIVHESGFRSIIRFANAPTALLSPAQTAHDSRCRFKRDSLSALKPSLIPAALSMRASRQSISISRPRLDTLPKLLAAGVDPRPDRALVPAEN